MAEQVKLQYCRGCHTEAEEHRFDGFKQCNMCREKGLTRVRRQVICSCGRTLLACSVKLHLRSLYHAEHTQPPDQQPPLPPPPQRQPALRQEQQQRAKQQQLQPPQQLPTPKPQPHITQQSPIQHPAPAQRQPPPKKMEPVRQQTANIKSSQQDGMKQSSSTPSSTSTAPVSKLNTAPAMLATLQARPPIKPAQR